MRPRREEGQADKGEDEVIRIGGVKRKKKKGSSNLPPPSELLTEGDIKKAYKVQEVVGEGYLTPFLSSSHNTTHQTHHTTTLTPNSLCIFFLVDLDVCIRQGC